MEAGVAHDVFVHVRIVMGTVIGLGLTRLLMGTAGLIQHPKRARLSLLHLLWVLSLSVELILFWWWEYDLSRLPSWNFGIFIFLIGYAVTLFALAALLFPDNLNEYDGYEDFFIKRRHWFFGIFGLTFLLDLVDTLIKGAPYFQTMDLLYLAQIPFGLVLSGIAIWTPNRRFHLAFVIIHLIYQAWSIGFYFETRG
ncbi:MULTISPECIES: hypothetical protein [unclassified Devosia]|jgi:hypothetical protein|uniref:hypothetical protein n=1 Tax=unclassified Devosia TaxID=196773 RepID=UPI0008695DFE|nr:MULTISPECIES: hypothetical protein [unclassified Devosia]MBN9363847.1 hypothetical protein [Devosia sp.]ODS83671.1 MAG: hypothetical protein ABS47_20305 [Devosia sp. SCN 66-27]OJX27127.1 MAG: hypothetical protein BGO83_25330 [Devosia sp. 66-14]